MSLLNEIVARIQVADVPELIVRLYLPGDDCLDDDTISRVFTRAHVSYGDTFLDTEFRVAHSFDDRHAVKTYDGTLGWFRNGKLHHENDKPAIIQADGTLEWFMNGQRYREDDKPLVVLKDGTKIWLDNYNNYHRKDDKPAKIYPDGTCKWYVHGELVRSTCKITIE